MSRNKNQRTSDSTAISEFGSGDKVLSATTNPVRKGTAPECANPKMTISDPAAMTDEQARIWTNDQKSNFEFLPQTPAAAAEITGVAASGFGFCRSQIPMVLQSMTQSAQSAVDMRYGQYHPLGT